VDPPAEWSVWLAIYTLAERAAKEKPEG